MVDLAYKYLEDVEQENIVTKQGYDKEGEASWQQTAPKLPNHARLAYILGISKQTLYNWSEPHEEDDEETKELRAKLLDCLSRVKALQEAMLSENGTAGVFNPAVTNRILAAQHGYKEKVDNTSDDKPLPAPTTIVVTDEKVQQAVAAFEEALRPKR